MPRRATRITNGSLELLSRGDIPRQPTPLIGRRPLLAEVQERLRAGIGLLTLTGPGGSGKTRLAIEVAATMQDEYPDGVWFVDLSSLRHAHLVLPSIAQTLGLPDTHTRSPLERLRQALKNQRLLLVLDNFEQVLEAAPELADLLQTCPGLQLLVTSREPLRLRWEYEQPVPPLELPDPTQLPPPDELARVEAVALFLERARAVQPTLSLTSENAPAVATICARLDGLPLAIELAAAHTKVLPPRALVGRLERRLEVLVGGTLDRPARHRTMAGAIAWSFDVLNEDEQSVFCRLGVMAGGCSSEAAEAVSGCDVSHVLGSLVDKSLLRVQEGVGGEPRFRMLDTIRSFALERLDARGEHAEVAHRHAAWCSSLAQRAEPELRGPEQVLWMDRLDQEHDNLRTALTWALDTGHVETALSLAGSIYLFWFTRGYFLEGQHWLDRALGVADTASVSPAVHAKALSAAGEMAWGRGELDRARRGHEAALAIRRELADAVGMAQSLHNLGNLAIERGEDTLARALHEEALGIRRDRGSPRDLALSLRNVARLATARGDVALAKSLLEEALQLSEESQHEVGRAEALRLLGDLALRQGHAARAAGMVAESLQLAHEVGAQGVIVNDIELLASIADARGRFQVVARLLGAVEALRERTRSAARPTERQVIERAIADVRTRLSDVDLAAAWAIGRGLTLDQIEELAQGLATDAPPHVTQTGLSAREREVVTLIAQGLTNRQIADQLIMSERTVHAHVRNILDKLGLASRTQVATWAMQHHLGPPVAD